MSTGPRPLTLAEKERLQRYLDTIKTSVTASCLIEDAETPTEWEAPPLTTEEEYRLAVTYGIIKS